MAKFLTYDINQVIINNNLFPANSISFQLAANTVPVKDINGNLLYYSPTSPIQGSVSINFFLTGAIPSYLRLENQNEIGNNIAFNQLSIPDCHLTNLSFSVRPFEPIPVKADFIFYHGIRALNTNLIQYASSFNGPIPNFQINQSFNSGLNILNGMSSSIITDNRSTYIQNPDDFVVTDFDYQFSVERVPVLRVGEYFPLRVAMKEINAEFNITASNLDGALDVRGNSAVFSAVLKDNTDANVSDTINVTGIIMNQSYEISEDNFGFSKIKMMQALNKKRSTITIPMEVNNPNIVNPPTKNNNVDIKPPEDDIDKEIDDSKKPDPTNLNIGRGAGTIGTTGPVDDNTVWHYITVVVTCVMARAEQAGNCYQMNLLSTPDFTQYNFGKMKLVVTNTSFQLIYDRTEFDLLINPKGNKYINNSGLLISESWDYTALGSIMTLKVNKEFLEGFQASTKYMTNVSNKFIDYTFRACNPTLLAIPVSAQQQTYSSFFRNSFFNAINDTHKNIKTPYIHDISIIPPNSDGILVANYGKR